MNMPMYLLIRSFMQMKNISYLKLAVSLLLVQSLWQWHLLRFQQRQSLQLSLESRSAWCYCYQNLVNCSRGAARVKMCRAQPYSWRIIFMFEVRPRCLRTKQTHCLRTDKSFGKQCMLMPGCVATICAWLLIWPSSCNTKHFFPLICTWMRRFLHICAANM
jgi:hypothetical protein